MVSPTFLASPVFATASPPIALQIDVQESFAQPNIAQGAYGSPFDEPFRSTPRKQRSLKKNSQRGGKETPKEFSPLR